MRHTLFLILLLGLFVLQSCNKEAPELEDKYEEIELREGDLREHRECFNLVFPVDIILPDRSKISVEDEADMQKKIKRWYEANSDIKERPGLSYPVRVTFQGDKSKIISSADEMIRLKKYCKERSWKERKACFRLIYPLTYSMPDGSDITGNDASDVKQQIQQWYEANPDSDEKPELSYPVDIKVENGDIISIQNEEEMIKLKKRCAERDENECYKLDYPVSFEMPDESILEFVDEEGMNVGIKAWYSDNPDSKERPELIYPVDIIYVDGKSYTINSEKEMIALKKKCDEK